MSSEEIDDVGAKVAATDAQLGAFQEAQTAAAKATQHDRTLIVRRVMLVYVGVVGATVIYLLFRGIWCHENVFSDIAEVIKIAVVPIVTLVIGYYFGSKGQ